MFFFFSKALLFLIKPFFWICVALIWAWKTKYPVRRRRLIWSGVGLFILFSNSFIFSEVVKHWEIPGQKISEVRHHDVAIVLGGMSEYNSDTESVSLRRPGDRLFQALQLYFNGKVDIIMISGDHGYITDRGLHEAKQIKEIIEKWKIPSEDILIETTSKNTYENAKNSAEILAKHPDIQSAVLVTSGVHMKRSLACFEKQGWKCTPHSTDLYSNQQGVYYWDQYFIPDLDNFYQWNRFIKEMVGYVAYRMKGYL